MTLGSLVELTTLIMAGSRQREVVRLSLIYEIQGAIAESEKKTLAGLAGSTFFFLVAFMSTLAFALLVVVLGTRNGRRLRKACMIQLDVLRERTC